ncbi:MAG: aminotransferase class V-fold PLP-dependent enzyme [Clostridia bacterium]|nr:aminotransferase class V-fold PLP-dependent enzyme [Clostridia bacterium]
MPELPELNNILHSGQLAYGTYTREFEEKLKKFFGTQYLIVTNSFNTAISVAITTLGLSFGDEVLASPMACLASTQPYLSSGLQIRWADVDNKLGALDPESVRQRITSNTKAIVHNHFCGYPGYIDEINKIAAEHGIPVIDDCIEGFGSEYKGKKLGSLGTDVTVFSLTAVRIPNTIDGGIVIFKNEELYKKSLLIRDCGIDRSNFRDSIGEINPECDINIIGYSATMSNVNGYIGSRQMDKVEHILEMQRCRAREWERNLSYLDDVRSIQKDFHNPNYWVYGIRANDKRKTILEFREKGYYASGVHINNNIYSIFGDYVDLPGTNDFYSHFVALPCGWWMCEE